MSDPLNELKFFYEYHDNSLPGKHNEVFIEPYQIPTLALFCLAGIIGVIGLLGNALAYRMSRHPDVKRSSYSAYLAFLSVVDSLDLLFTLANTIADHLHVTNKFLGSHSALCKVTRSVQYWTGDVSAAAILLLAFDRYMALVLTAYKSKICTHMHAHALLSVYCFLLFLVGSPYYMQSDVVEFPSGNVCKEDDNIPDFFYITCITSGLLPCTLLTYFALHIGLVLLTRSSSTEDDQTTIDDWETGRPMVVLFAVSALTRTPQAILEIVQKYYYLQLSNKNNFSMMPTAKVVFGMKDSIAIVFCIDLSMKFYLLYLASPFFRRCIRKTTQRGEQAIELPGDRRVMTALADGLVFESTTRQTVDLGAFNLQRERNQSKKQLSSSSSVDTNNSGQSEVEIIESSGSRRLGSGRRHSRDEFSSLDEIAEESCETTNSGSSRRLGNELYHGGDELSSLDKIEEDEDLHGEDNADESSKGVLEGAGSLDESDALRDSRDYGHPQAVGPETSTSEDSSVCPSTGLTV